MVAIRQPFKLVGRELDGESAAYPRRRRQYSAATASSSWPGPVRSRSPRDQLAHAHGGPRRRRQVLRGGAYKPRTSPYDFQGLEEEGLKLLAEARELTGLRSVPKS